MCCQSRTDIAQRIVFDVMSLMLIYSTNKTTTEIYHFIHFFSEATVEYSWWWIMSTLLTFSEWEDFRQTYSMYVVYKYILKLIPWHCPWDILTLMVWHQQFWITIPHTLIYKESRQLIKYLKEQSRILVPNTFCTIRWTAPSGTLVFSCPF